MGCAGSTEENGASQYEQGSKVKVQKTPEADSPKVEMEKGPKAASKKEATAPGTEKQAAPAAEKEVDEKKPAAKPQVVEAPKEMKKPLGTQLHIVMGPKVLVTAYILDDAWVGLVLGFMEWQLQLNQDKLPKEGYSAQAVVKGMSSGHPEVLDDGLIFHPEDKVTELDGWDEGERFKFLITPDFDMGWYAERVGQLKELETYWKGTSDVLILDYPSDIRFEDLPADVQKKYPQPPEK